jgi:hypothetical protein
MGTALVASAVRKGPFSLLLCSLRRLTQLLAMAGPPPTAFDPIFFHQRQTRLRKERVYSARTMATRSSSRGNSNRCPLDHTVDVSHLVYIIKAAKTYIIGSKLTLCLLVVSLRYVGI